MSSVEGFDMATKVRTFLGTLLLGAWGCFSGMAQGDFSMPWFDDSVMDSPPGGLYPLRLEEAIFLAHSRSLDAMIAKYSFFGSYWEYRSYKASRLPSLNLKGNLFNFDRSIRLLQDYSGELGFVENYSLENTLGLSISQNIAFTGGVVEVYSSLGRLDQFVPDKSHAYYTQPITLTYTQPLFAYNQFKWDKKISPKEYELAQRAYVEAMEDVTLNAVMYYYDLLKLQNRYDIAVQSYRNTKVLYSIALQRNKIGSITVDELLQLELRMLNDSLSIGQALLDLDESRMQLNSFLRYAGNVRIQPVMEEGIPDMEVDYRFAIEKALQNSSFPLQNQIDLLTAESEIAMAKAERGASASINARFGASQTGEKFTAAYANLLDQEVVGLEFSIPLFDWGMGRGRVRMAKARAEVVKSQVEQDEIDFRKTLFMIVQQIESQRQQCRLAKMARNVAQRRYAVAVENFRRGMISVTDMNMAQSENDEADQAYLAAIADFWSLYYTLRRKTLYDFVSRTDIRVDLEKLVQEAEGKKK